MESYWDLEFEKYKNSHSKAISDLSYLDLATAEKVSNKDLAFNLHINTYRSDLGFKVAIHSLSKNRELLIQNRKLLEEQKQQLSEINNLSKVVRLQRADLKETLKRQDVLAKELQALRKDYLERRPLSKEDVEELVVRISEQPKFIEKQTEALTIELTKEVNTLKSIIKDFEQRLLG
ncbi:ORFI [Banana streak virus Acuminata Yunnan]|uniref:ORFI n=1 Tax=Banana streak virus Acuminata Yunnan TaxID=334778 RepID=UPI0000552CF8|nr:ORFI [Banana streak virus Acuminata Yunnan]AAY99425.1 ORFI [Banana streak virus Acuminata Yunnan]